MSFALTTPENSNHVIVISRVFDAPRELVFRAWTDARHIARWWGPNGFSGEDCEVDFRVGGGIRLQLRGPDGNRYPCDAVIREIVPPERIVFAGSPDDGPGCGAGLPPRSLVTVTFVESGGKTTLTIQTQLASAADRQAAIDSGFNPGWEQCLERLAGCLEAT